MENQSPRREQPAQRMPFTRIAPNWRWPIAYIRRFKLQQAAGQAEARRLGNEQRLGVPIPRIISISLTTRCDNTCAYCGAPQNKGNHDLHGEKAHKIVTEAEALGIFTFVLLGGEPLLCEILIMSLAKYHPKSQFLLFTGLHQISEKEALKLRSANLIVVVSTDTLGSRGTQVRKQLHRAGVNTGFSVVIDEDGAKRVSSAGFIFKMKRAGSYFGIIFERLPIGCAKDMGMGLSHDSRQEVREKLRTASKHWKMPIWFFPEDENMYGGCAAAGHGILHINAQGAVEPCPFIHDACEDMNDKSLSEVLLSPVLESIRKKAASHTTAGTPCALLPT